MEDVVVSVGGNRGVGIEERECGEMVTCYPGSRMGSDELRIMQILFHIPNQPPFFRPSGRN